MHNMEKTGIIDIVVAAPFNLESRDVRIDPADVGIALKKIPADGEGVGGKAVVCVEKKSRLQIGEMSDGVINREIARRTRTAVRLVQIDDPRPRLRQDRAKGVRFEMRTA